MAQQLKDISHTSKWLEGGSYSRIYCQYMCKILITDIWFETHRIQMSAVKGWRVM
uniref:Uncharacterized protein n=1 Tax=Moniliophthora roreri TaxID=221103 RepID=A0A0W0F7G1_MONRR